MGPYPLFGRFDFGQDLVGGDRLKHFDRIYRIAKQDMRRD
jgi:hypothetical protein